jgi:hypothetical protein
MNDEYDGLTPVETEDEMRERYERLGQETIASWGKKEQARQAEIDAVLLNPIVIKDSVDISKPAILDANKNPNWIHDYIAKHMKL